MRSRMRSGGRSEEIRTRLGLTGFLLVTLVQAGAMTPHGHSSVIVSAPYASYICPEGATVQLTCAQSGAEVAGAGDRQRHPWRFTPDMNQDCHERKHPRAGRHDVVYAARGELFWVELQNVTREDQGRYCCLSLTRDHGKAVQMAHSHVTLTVTRKTGSLNCSHWSSHAPEATVTASLATAACIMAILSLPLILLLVYRQKSHSRSSRRAHELVRMDSEAHGHANPVYQGGSPQGKGRSVAQIMTRQSSETGRHLLADPGTPLSPPGHGEVFFPSHDPIPEGPDFMQV